MQEVPDVFRQWVKKYIRTVRPEAKGQRAGRDTGREQKKEERTVETPHIWRKQTEKIQNKMN